MRFPRIVVLVDGENVFGGAKAPIDVSFPELFTNLGAFLRDHADADLAVVRVYANWSVNDRTRKHQQEIRKLRYVEPVMVRSNGKPQVADLYLACDAIALAMSHPLLDVFVIVSDDTDFDIVGEHLTRMGRKVLNVSSRRLCRAGTHATATGAAGVVPTMWDVKDRILEIVDSGQTSDAEAVMRSVRAEFGIEPDERIVQGYRPENDLALLDDCLEFGNYVRKGRSLQPRTATPESSGSYVEARSVESGIGGTRSSRPAVSQTDVADSMEAAPLSWFFPVEN